MSAFSHNKIGYESVAEDLLKNSRIISLWAEDSAAVREENQKIRAMHPAQRAQQTAFAVMEKVFAPPVPLFSCCIYKRYPPRARMKLYSAYALCLSVVAGFIEYG